MYFSEGIFAELAKPFPVDAIHWRVGSTNKNKVRRETGNQNAKPTKGIPLAYVDARDVMDRLDNVLGPDGWQDEYVETQSGRIICKLRCHFPGVGWVTKSDGAGNTAEEGEKGAISDAFKRTAVKLGVARYLYSLPNKWVDLDEWGKFKEQELPDWANPKGYELNLSRKVNRITAQQALIRIIEYLRLEDSLGIKEVVSELSQEEQSFIWRILDSKQKSSLRAILHPESE